VSPGRRGEVVLITGCSDGGIGAALAVEFCENGFTVVATSRSVSTMKALERHQHIEALALDVLSEESIREAVESVIATYGRIDILVNNAGVPCTAPLAEIPIDVVDKVYRTNYLGTQPLRSLTILSSLVMDFRHVHAVLFLQVPLC
jgi:NAD(P)-dependent dehydrogenase (short-subunit alcohol dehydrogenase family)